MSDMEIYRNQPTTVTFRAPLPDGVYSIEVKSPQHTSTIQSVTPQHDVSYNDHVLKIPVDFKHTWYDGKIDFSITVQGGTPTTEHTYSEYADVVTPLFTWADLGTEYPEDKTPELERLVRHVIEAYTGQSFGKTIERQVIDSGSNVLQFGQPLIELRGISDRYVTHTTTLSPPKMPYEIFHDGYGLAIDWSNYHVKTDSMWVLDRKCPKCYVIEGTFGYHYVPADVKQAALLIAGVWGCKQAVWRDRFIKTMRSTDWSVTYDDAAFDKWSTGSIAADHLLSKYTRRYLPEVF